MKVDELMCAGAGVLQGLVAPTARGYHGLGTTGVSSHISLGQVPQLQPKFHLCTPFLGIAWPMSQFMCL